MTKKNLFLALLAIGLAAVYAIWFTDWFQPKTVQIFHTDRNLHPRRQRDSSLPPLIFGVNHQLKLTEIKVVPLAVWQTNPQVLPLWHLVSDSNSISLKAFQYGAHIGGMRPAVAGSRAQPLETNVAYRLFVTAGKITGQHDFELGGKLPEATNAASH